MQTHIREALDKEIEKIAELERQLEIARARRELLEDLLGKEESPSVEKQRRTRIIRPATSSLAAATSDAVILAEQQSVLDSGLFKNRVPAPIPIGHGSAKRSKPLSDTWKEILRFIGFDGKEVKEIWDYVRDHNMQMARNNIRSQCSNMSNKLKYLENVDNKPGKYRLTKAGADACGARQIEGGGTMRR